MTKIAVGIGEDFPADDSKPVPDDDRRAGDDARCAARREAYRKWREQRRQWKRQWRNELRARTRTARAPLQDTGRAAQKDPLRQHHAFDQNPAILWAILGVIAVIAAISFVFSHLFVAVGVVALLALFAAYYRGDEPFGFVHDGAMTPQQAAN